MSIASTLFSCVCFPLLFALLCAFVHIATILSGGFVLLIMHIIIAKMEYMYLSFYCAIWYYIWQVYIDPYWPF